MVPFTCPIQQKLLLQVPSVSANVARVCATAKIENCEPKIKKEFSLKKVYNQT